MRLINRHCSDGVLCSPGGHRRIVWRTACFLAVATAALLPVACGGDDPVEPVTPVPSEVAVSPSEARLEALGATVQLSATVRDQNGQVMPGVSVTWGSGDVAVATVSAEGLVTAVSNGTVRVMVSVGAASGSADIAVEQVIAEVDVSPALDTLFALGDTVRLAAEARDANGHPVAGAELTWSSADESVVTVDESGLVTAVANGTASVTAASGGQSASAMVTVEQVVAEVVMSPAADTLFALGDTVRLAAEARDANGHPVAGAELTWSSADESVVTVDESGLVTAVANGTASVTAASGGRSANAMVTVEQVVAEVVVLPAVDTLVALGDTARFTAEARDANGHPVAGAELTWSSADESVVTVDESGLVTAVANGTASVTAASGGRSANAMVTVEQVVAEVVVLPAVDTLVALGDTARFTAEARDANGHPVAGAELTWSSADESVVTVDESGLVTAVANGTASVTAASGGRSANAMVTVEQVVAEVVVLPAVDTLVALGDTARFTAEARDANGHPVAGAELTWSSADESVVTVDESGLVTAVANGTASVTAASGGRSANAMVTVEQVVAEVVVLPAVDTLVALGDTARFTAEARDANGHPVAGAELTWSSADESVVTVDESGVVTAVANGTASVTVSSGGQSASAMVTVEQRVASVRVSPAVDTLVALGDTVRLSLEATDAKGNRVADAMFTWSSGDQSVVTVDTDGLVTAVFNGTASVTAASGELSGSAMVTVEQRVAQVSVSPAADTLVALGDTVRFSSGRPMDANGYPVADASITWASGDEAVATVDTTGLVTAVGDGTASVTASSGGVDGGATLTVAQLAVEMRLSPEADTLATPGDTLRLIAEADDANGHLLGSPRFTWTSADESVATVDESGLVTGIAEGTVEVTAVEGTAGLTRSAVLLVVEPRRELLELYEALGGTGWANGTNWGTDAPLSEWHGVTTDSEGWITEIDLSDNGLTGEIPPEIGRLEHLEVLDLSGNGISAAAGAVAENDLGPWGPALGLEALDPRDAVEWGLVPAGLEDPLMDEVYGYARAPDVALERRVAYASQQSTDGEVCARPTGPLVGGDGLTNPIPPELGALRNLRVLDLSYNSLTGQIPPELGNMESLEVLDLGWNTLEGPIPPELGQLGNLRVLNACANRRWDGSMYVGPLTGSIPAELGDLVSLEVLHLWANALEGPIPPELGNLMNLEVLNLAANPLGGAIPPELGNLRALEVLDLQADQLTGSIPPELGDLMMLDSLRLSYNQLTGMIPPELGQLSALTYVHIGSFGSNQLTGVIPPELGQLSGLKYLSLSNNQLTGEISPRLVQQLGSLENLYLYGNQLTGPIPPGLGQLSGLKDLILDSNQLSGTIPRELGQLRSLQRLSLHNNQLTGSIPPEVWQLKALTWLALSNNPLTGSIPPGVGQLRDLETLYLSDIGLAGPIPSELGNLGSLRFLYLNDNNLTGPIPPELGNLQSLLVMGFWTNDLTGTIPTELAQLQNLRTLSVSANNLTGGIPAELANIPNLGHLSLSDNNLTGTIPPELGSLERLGYLRLAGNPLTGTIPPELQDLKALTWLWLHDTELEGALPDGFVNFPLRLFHWQRSNLCAPANDTFLKWLESIPDHMGGETCSSSAASARSRR